MNPQQALNVLNQVRLQVNATGKNHEELAKAIQTLQDHLNKDEDEYDADKS